MDKKKKVRKGDYGYIQSQQKKRVWHTVLAFLPPLTVFIIGMILNDGDRKNIFTVVAAVSCIPACKFAVGMIMMFLQKPMSQKDYARIEEHKNGLVLAYELVISAYEKQTFLDSLAVCGNTVAGYTSREKSDAPFAEKHIQNILRENGYYVNVKIFRKLPDYLNRLDSMSRNRENLEKDIPFTPDENYPDLTRNELILHTIYAISL